MLTIIFIFNVLGSVIDNSHKKIIFNNNNNNNFLAQIGLLT